MSAEGFLRSSERSALNNNQFVSHVTGKNTKMKSSKKLRSLGAVGFIVAMIALVAVLFGAGNIIPTTIYENLISETDMQCADATVSKNLALQQALRDGEIPDDTAALLKEKGVLVGYMDGDNFVENNKAGVRLMLKRNGKLITAEDCINEVGVDSALLGDINYATYGCGAYYYDEAANKVFEEIGTSRNNFTSEDDFDEKMDSLIGEGSDVGINSVYLTEVTEKNSDGTTETHYKYVENGTMVNSSEDTAELIKSVASKNSASDTTTATLNSADQLKVAETITREQRSMKFFAYFMENFSKMKAGDGNDSKLNDEMNSIYEQAETEVEDIKTAKIIKVTGTALDSPSLYPIISGEKVNMEEVENHSTDRVLKIVENQVGSKGSSAISSTVASSSSKDKGTVGRFISDGVEGASNTILSLVEPTLNKSLATNSYSDIKGIDRGEMIAEGAVTLGSKLARQSGATMGDGAAVESYARLNNKIAKMNAEIDRMNRSPFDITSKNTFLGAIFRNFAMASMKFSGVFSGVKSFSSTVNSAVVSLLPTSYADEAGGYLTNFGDCETYATIGAVGSAQCAPIATFDTSTLNDPFNDAGFMSFVENNTTLSSSGVRKINEGSDLANFILYNNERKTPLGVMDGGILDSLNNESSSIPFLSDIAEMIEIFMGTSEENKRFASGEEFVNSSANPDWQTYKYAQRYVSLARATAALKQYTDDETAYNNMKFFEGSENPVVAFIKNHNTLANR